MVIRLFSSALTGAKTPLPEANWQLVALLPHRGGRWWDGSHFAVFKFPRTPPHGQSPTVHEQRGRVRLSDAAPVRWCRMDPHRGPEPTSRRGRRSAPIRSADNEPRAAPAQSTTGPDRRAEAVRAAGRRRRDMTLRPALSRAAHVRAGKLNGLAANPGAPAARVPNGAAARSAVRPPAGRSPMAVADSSRSAGRIALRVVGPATVMTTGAGPATGKASAVGRRARRRKPVRPGRRRRAAVPSGGRPASTRRRELSCGRS
jgi:hypothetical protein